MLIKIIQLNKLKKYSVLNYLNQVKQFHLCSKPAKYEIFCETLNNHAQKRLFFATSLKLQQTKPTENKSIIESQLKNDQVSTHLSTGQKGTQ